MTHAPDRAIAAETLGDAAARGIDLGRRALRAALVGANLLGIATLTMLLLTERIDDDLAFRPPVATEGGLASVDMAVALIERETRRHGWVPNDPAFLPGHWLPNMKAYQEGMVYALSRFAFELADTLGRARGTTAVDPDLDRAAGLLRFPGNVWVFDFEKTWAPTITSEAQYLSAARALAAYNARVGSGGAVFNPRADSLLAALSRIEADISSKANVLVERVERTAAGLPNPGSANDAFFNTKGSLYAYAMVLEALGQDFAEVIERHGLGLVWSRMITSLHNAAAMHPLIVTESPPGSMLLPSHIAELGFFTLRVKTQLHDVMAVLRQG